MILPPNYNNSLFPDDNVPEEEKLKPKFGIQVGRALYSKFYNGATYYGVGQWSAMREIENYGSGIQDNTKYINYSTNGSSIGNSSLKNNSKKNNDSGGGTYQGSGSKGKSRKGFANISYDIFSPMAKLVNVLLSVINDNDYKVDVISTDKNIVSKKRESKADLYVKSKIINPLSKKLGIPEMKVPFVPKDEKEIEIADKLGFFKTRQEVALEKLGELGLRASKWKTKRTLFNRDAINFHFRIAKLYHDKQTGQVKFKYVSPCNTVMLWDDNDDNQPAAIGHIEGVKIQDIFQQLIESGMTEEQIQAMAKANAAFQTPNTANAPWMWERKDQTTNQWLWMDFKIYVLHFEYLSTDYKHYAKREIKGNTYYQKLKDRKAFSEKNPKVQVDEYRCNYWYEGSYIISSGNMDKVFGWRKKPNQMQKGLTPMSSYVFDRVLGEAPTSRVIGFLDDLMFAVCKLRAAVWAAAPKGYAIDVSGAANIKIGGQEYDIFDLIHIQRQNGIRIVSTKFNAATGKFQTEVLKPEDNGIGPQAMEWMNQIAFCLNMIKDTMGIPDAMAATPNQSAERTAGVMEADIDSGNNANWILKDSERRFKEKLVERIILQSRIDIEYDKDCAEFYSSVIGPEMIKVLDEIEGLSLDQMGMSTKALPTEKEKDLIMQRAVEMSKIATRDGSVLLDPASIERINQLLKNDDIDEALWFMSMEVKQNREREQANAEKMAQMTFEGQQKSATVAEEEKRKTLQLAAQMEVVAYKEKANIDMMKESQIAKVKGDKDYQIQLLKGKQVLDEITLEATLESQLGLEITGRI